MANEFEQDTGTEAMDAELEMDFETAEERDSEISAGPVNHNEIFTPEFLVKVEQGIFGMLEKYVPMGRIVAAADQYDCVIGRCWQWAVQSNLKYNAEFHFELKNISYRYDDPDTKLTKIGEKREELERRLLDRHAVIFQTRLIWVKQGIDQKLRAHIQKYCPENMHGATFQSWDALVDAGPAEYDFFKSHGVDFEENMIDRVDSYRSLGSESYDAEEAQRLAKFAVSLFTRKGEARAREFVDSLSDSKRAQLLFYLRMAA